MQNPVEFKKFSLDNKGLFDKAYEILKFPLAEHSFSWIYAWEDCYKDIEWATINGNLCLFLTFEGNRYVWGPVLPGNKLPDTVKKCFEICEQYNKEKKIKGKIMIKYIPEELKEEYNGMDDYKLSHQNQDYIYKRKDIIELKGDKYKSKRNLRNYFLKNYKFDVEDYKKEKHLEGCLELLNSWKEQKLKVVGGEDKEKLDFEYFANKKAFELANELGINGIVVYVDDKIEGYTFGEKNNNICIDFFEKTNLDIKGLSVFIYGEFLKRMGCEIVNAGEDWDVDYLRKIKMSYKPYLIKKSYMLEKVN